MVPFRELVMRSVERTSSAAVWAAAAAVPAGKGRLGRTRGRATATVAATRTNQDASALVIGGGFAGLSASKVLTEAGVKVTLIERGRGLGGRVCTRRRDGGGTDMMSWDHGCQYLTDKGGRFSEILKQLEADGIVAGWDGKVGDVPRLMEDGSADWASFERYPPSKRLLVGVPTNSAVGAAIAGSCGNGLRILRATEAAAVTKLPSGRWAVELQTRDPSLYGASEAVAASGGFDVLVTAMSSRSTSRLLSSAAPAVASVASAIESNVCWALMLSLPAGGPASGIPADGCLFPTCETVAWIARDSSKPGRAGAGERWVVHAAPAWSNSRADLCREVVASELCAALDRLVGCPEGTFESAASHTEVHRWNNAYPLNPLRKDAGGCIIDAHLGLVACGDWCMGPRAGDAFNSGAAAGQAALGLLESHQAASS